MSGPAPPLCRRCGSTLSERQRWCLECGAATLTTVGSPRRWARVGAAATLVALLALIGIGYAIAALVSS